MIALEVYLIQKGKRTVCSTYLPPTDQGTEEDMKELMEQLPAPMILLGDFNVWGSEKMSTRGRMIEKILNRYNLLCINNKEETYYRAFDGCKWTIKLTIASLTITLELEWSKNYELRGSDHFAIIEEKQKEISMKQHQSWSIGRANWTQFQKESTIATKVHNQNIIEEAHSCLVNTILQQQRKPSPKHPQRQREDQ